jgi:hypothetical protein
VHEGGNVIDRTDFAQFHKNDNSRIDPQTEVLAMFLGPSQVLGRIARVRSMSQRLAPSLAN